MSRARRARKPRLGPVVATARLRYARVGPRKVRDVADLIRGLTVAEANQQLAVLHRPSAVPLITRLLKSAVSNAGQDGPQHKEADLIIGEITVDAGPVSGRYRPRAMGRSAVIRKRTTHVTVKLHTGPE